jgi:hypothetical protein
MAAIDKIYGTKEQHDEFYAWAKENNPLLLDYFYTWDGEWLYDGREHPITNFPEFADVWVYHNCPITWVVDYIRDQYNGDPLQEATK